MELQYRVAKPRGDQATVHDVERSRFLCNEEDGLSFRQALRDHVRDRLALPCPGRPHEDEIQPLCRRDHGSQLRTVGRQRRVQRTWRVPPVDLYHPHRFNTAPFRTLFFWPVDQMPDQAVLAETVGAIDKVLPHQVLRKGERGERQIFDHLETGHIAHLPPHRLQDCANIDAAIVAWQVRFELR